MRRAAIAGWLCLLAAPQPALACGTYTMAMRWRYSDVVADGALVCPGLRNPCTVRAARVLKPLSAGGVERRSFPVEMPFDVRRDPAEISCGGPVWLPTAERTRGRYFLVRDERGRYFMNGGTHFPYGGRNPPGDEPQEDRE